MIKRKKLDGVVTVTMATEKLQILSTFEGNMAVRLSIMAHF